MPIDPPVNDGGPSFVWTCSRCPERGVTLSWHTTAAALRDHRATRHGIYASELYVGIRTVPCIDCGTPVTVQRARQPRCPEHLAIHNRNTARSRRGEAA